MRRRDVSIDLDRLRERWPFPEVVARPGLEPAGAFGQSGTACFASSEDGTGWKVRLCRSALRAREIEHLIALAPGLFPRLVARSGRLLLFERLTDHREITREELLERLPDLGAMVATIHRAADDASLPRPGSRLLSQLRARYQLSRDLRRLGASDRVEASVLDALRTKCAHHSRAFGLPVAVELDDLHKGNFMVREVDGDLRYVDEEGVAIRPLGTGLASLAKTADQEAHWEAFRTGYASISDPAFITPAFTEYVVLLDTIRKVAHKLRGTEALGAERLEKLPEEIEDLRRLAERETASVAFELYRGPSADPDG